MVERDICQIYWNKLPFWLDPNVCIFLVYTWLSLLIHLYENLYLFYHLSDIAIQNIVLEAPWFKSSTRLCAYISCDALREVDTSKILSAVLSDPNTGMFSNLTCPILNLDFKHLNVNLELSVICWMKVQDPFGGKVGI